jgi:hypothetical protein
MASFFSRIKRGLASGHRSGQAVKILQNVLGRSLGPNELKGVQRFGEKMDFPDSVDEYDFAIEWIRNLVSGDNLPKAPPDAASWVLDCAVMAINNGILHSKSRTREELISLFESLRDRYI